MLENTVCRILDVKLQYLINEYCLCVRLRLDCQFEVTQIRFFALMWHVSDLCHDSVNSKKTHAFRSTQIGYRPLPYVVLNQIWIGYLFMCLQSKQTNRIFQCNASHTSLICDNFAPVNDVRLQFKVGELAERKERSGRRKL